VFAEPKVRSSPEASKKGKSKIPSLTREASSRGGVWRKPNPKARSDVQEPDLRCGTSGTSGHVTMKSSIRNWDVLYKSGVYARKALCLTPGGLLCALGSRVREKLAEHRAIGVDRIGEVSRGHSRRTETDTISFTYGRTRNPPCNRKSRSRKLSAYPLREMDVMPPLKA